MKASETNRKHRNSTNTSPSSYPEARRCRVTPSLALLAAPNAIGSEKRGDVQERAAPARNLVWLEGASNEEAIDKASKRSASCSAQ